MKKTAIVTGGSRGIGFGIVRQLAKDGFSVAIMAVNPMSHSQENYDELARNQIDFHFVQGTVAEQADRERCIAEILDHYGRIDVLVNNAGVAPLVRADLLDMTEESFDRLITINTKGTLFMSQLAAKQMIRQEPVNGLRGIIININSISAVVSSVNRGEYCISKAANAMVTTLFADRLADERILVYEVRPGIISTDMTSTVKEKYDELFAQGISPIKRWGTPEDVANAVSVLASGKLSYTTGQYIDVDGGFHILRL